MKKKRPFRHRQSRKARDKGFQRSHPRFPRLKRPDETFEFLRQLREEYPLPGYNKLIDGSWNPGETVLSWLTKISEKELKKRCLYHGLLGEGTRFDMIKRMYLHWRAGKLKLGFPLVAYTTGCEKYGPSQCACGQMRADSTRISRYPRYRQRFPRLPTTRFPRFRNKFDPAIHKWWKEYRKWFKEETGISLGLHELLFYQ